MHLDLNAANLPVADLRFNGCAGLQALFGLQLINREVRIPILTD